MITSGFPPSLSIIPTEYRQTWRIFWIRLASERIILGLITLFVKPRRIPMLAAIVKPATLLKFHRALVDRKYRRLFSYSGNRHKPGPKGPSPDLIAVIVEMKSRNPSFGYARIAQQIARDFGIDLDKDVVRRVLEKHYRSSHPGSDGLSWLTFLAQA